MSSVKRNFVYNSLYQVLNLTIPLLTTPYLSRVLGAEGLGIYSYYYSIAHYFLIFILLGVNNYGNREIAKVNDNPTFLKKTFWEIYDLQFLLGIIISCIYIVFVIAFSDNSKVSLIMLLYVLSGVFDASWCCFGLEQFKLITIRNATVKLLNAVAIFVFIRSETDVLLYCLIMVGGILLSQLSIWPYVLKKVGFYRPQFKEILKHFKPNCFLFLTTLAVSMFKIMDKIMLGALSDVTQVGFYEASEKVISIPTALITALGTVMLPRMTSLMKHNDSRQGQYLEKSILFAMFFSTSLSFGIMGVSDVFVPMFYGSGYDICIVLYEILLPSCIFLAFANVVRTQFILPSGRDKIYVISAFLGAGVNLVINFILIPQFAAIGAAIGTLGAEMAVCFYQCYNVRKDIPIGRYVKLAMPFLGAGSLMYVLLKQIQKMLFINNNYFELVLLIFIGILIYIATMLLMIGAKKIMNRMDNLV